MWPFYEIRFGHLKRLREISQKTHVSTLLEMLLLKTPIGCFEQGGKTGVSNTPIVLMCRGPQASHGGNFLS